jgi:hypothetical protein
VRLSAEERAQLDELIRKGKRSAQLLTKARILLKADVPEFGAAKQIGIIQSGTMRSKAWLGRSSGLDSAAQARPVQPPPRARHEREYPLRLPWRKPPLWNRIA